MACEDYGSSDSVSGDQENDNGSSHKSPAVGEKSPGQTSSSSSTHADDEGGSPCSAQGEGGVVVDRISSSIPQQFERISTDRESTCARTDLVYVHPPPPVKQLQASTTKVRSQIFIGYVYHIQVLFINVPTLLFTIGSHSWGSWIQCSWWSWRHKGAPAGATQPCLWPDHAL